MRTAALLQSFPGSSGVSPWLIGTSILVVFAILGYFAHLAEKKRIAELTAWANGRGWSFSAARRKPTGLPFELFDQGHSRYTSHHVHGHLADALRGLPDPALDLFHFHYAITTGSGKDRSTTHYHHCCALVDTGIELGEVTVRTENFFDRFAALVGFDDIDFEDPEFSKRFHVKARDRRSAYALFGHELTDFLVASPMGFMTSGALLLVHESGHAKVETFDRLADSTQRLLGHLPRLLVNTERERRGLPPLLDAGAARGGARPESSPTPSARADGYGPDGATPS